MVSALIRTAVVVPLVALAVLAFALALLVESFQQQSPAEKQGITVGARMSKCNNPVNHSGRARD
jgi:hypothetical protein